MKDKLSKLIEAWDDYKYELMSYKEVDMTAAEEAVDDALMALGDDYEVEVLYSARAKRQ